MAFNLKKIIAREFLFLLGSIIILLIAEPIRSHHAEILLRKLDKASKEMHKVTNEINNLKSTLCKNSYRLKVYNAFKRDFPSLLK